MAMDRTETIGLGSAIGAHAILFALFALGVFGAGDRLVRPKPIEVSLVGEIGPETTSPDPSEEAPAAETEFIELDSAAPDPDAAPDAPAQQVAEAVAKPQQKPISKPKPKPIKKSVAQPKVKPKPKPKPKKKSGGFGSGFESRISGIGGGSKAGQPKSSSANGAGSSASSKARGKSAREVRRSVTAALASQIRPYLQSCAPSGVDINAIRTFITLSLRKDGSVSSVRFDKQLGVNASNAPQAEPLKQCAVQAARQASPYRGLDPEYHQMWKSHALQLKAR